METLQQAVYRVLYREPDRFDEFLSLYAKLKVKGMGNIEQRLFMLLREAIYAEHVAAQEFLWSEIQECKLACKSDSATLKAALYMGNMWMIRELLNGAGSSRYGILEPESLLICAASRCQLDAVCFLLDLTDYSKDDLDEALYSACEAPEMEFVPVEKVAPVVKRLLEAGASPNPDIHPSWSTLDEVVSNDDEDTAILLIEYGAGVSDCNKQANTWWSYDMKRVIHELIRQGLRANTPVRVDGVTFLMDAIWNHDIETLKLLLSLGADVEISDAYGKTAMDYAIEQNQQEIIELLNNYVEGNTPSN